MKASTAAPVLEDRSGGLGVVLGADSLLTRRSGIGRMTLEIATAVHAHPAVAGFRLLMQDRLHPFDAIEGLLETVERPASLWRQAKRLLAPVPGVQGLRAARARWKQAGELRWLRAAAPGGVVYHEPNMIPAPFCGTTVVTVNDLSWHHHPEMHPRERIAWIARHLPRALAQAARFVAISDFTAAALVSEFGVARDRIDVVPLAANTSFVPVGAVEATPALARLGLEDRCYVLTVSTIEPRKNFDRLLAAHRRLPAALRQRFPLAIVGGSGWGAALSTRDAEAARAEGTLRMLGYVPDADLVPLYSRAAVFAYVSLYEGFGLPVIEAMAAGAPVLAASTTAVGETAGNAAVLVDPLDVDAMAAALRALLEDPVRGEALRAEGAAHAAAFTWQRTADLLVASWRRAIADGPG